MLALRVSIVAQVFPNPLSVHLENSQLFLELFKRKNVIFAKKATIVSMELLRLLNALKVTIVQWGLKNP
jgi:hypothetical protein